MASKRIAKSAVDWAAFQARVPPTQKEAFRLFKSRSDYFLSKIYRYPEAPAKIDFATYRAKISNKSLVDKLEKEYAALSVPYPTDAFGKKDEIAQMEAKEAEESKQFVAKNEENIALYQELITKIDKLPPFEEFTWEMMADYFPEWTPDPVHRPTFWPHVAKEQSENETGTFF